MQGSIIGSCLSPKFLFLLMVAFVALVLSSSSASAGPSCTGIVWTQPTWPNVTNSYANWGGYDKVRSSYNNSTNCDGYATKSAVTGTWNGKPTKQPNAKGYNSVVYTVDDSHGNKQFIMSQAEGLHSINGGSSFRHKAGSSGNHYNTGIVQDTLWFDNPGAGAGVKADIDFRLCYKYITSDPTDLTYATWADGYTEESIKKFQYPTGEPLSADTWSWDVSGGNKINHGNGSSIPWVWEKCNTGKFTMDATGAGYYSRLYYYGTGTHYYDATTMQHTYQGKVETCFQITGMDTGVTCKSASGVFPGCEFEIDPKDQCGESRKKAPDRCEAGNEATESGGTCSAAEAPVCGNDINFAYGFVTQGELDYSASGQLEFERIYRSNGDWLEFNMGKYWGGVRNSVCEPF